MGKRVLAVDAYDVIDIFLKLGVSFEDIASLEFHFEDEPDRRLRAEFIAAWYRRRKAGAGASEKHHRRRQEAEGLAALKQLPAILVGFPPGLALHLYGTAEPRSVLAVGALGGRAVVAHHGDRVDGPGERGVER